MKSSNSPQGLEKVHLMIQPPHDWLTKPPAVAADGNPEMLQAILDQKTHPAGSGALVIQNLAALYRHLGFQVALFESSQAAQKVTQRIIGQPNPDDVFTVDYVTGHALEATPNWDQTQGDTINPGQGSYVNIINRMSAATRLLEPFVMQIIAERLGVQNILTQPTAAKFEGGDFNFIPHAFGEGQSLLVTGGGINSRSNAQGHEWLQSVLKPKHYMKIASPEFHRDLVSVLVQNARGKLVQALLALELIQNKDQVVADLEGWGVEVVSVPQPAVGQCAVNLLVNPGLLVGMQSHEGLTKVLKNGLPDGVEYHALPPYLQKLMSGFIDMQGGANCVSGHVLVEPDQIDLADGNLADINVYLHGKDCEEYLDAKAKEIGMQEAVKASKAKQFAPKT